MGKTITIPGYATVPQFAEMLGVSVSTVEKLCRDGMIKRYLPRGRERGYMIKIEESLKMLEDSLVES